MGAEPAQERVKVGREECRPSGLDDSEIPGGRRKLRQFLCSGSSGNQKPSHLCEEFSPALVNVYARGPMPARCMDDRRIGGPSSFQCSLEIRYHSCLLYTSDAADDLLCVDL